MILYKEHFLHVLIFITMTPGKSLNLTLPEQYTSIINKKKMLKRGNIPSVILYQNESKHSLDATSTSQEVKNVCIVYHHIIRIC